MANNVVGLVFVAAFAPDESERLGDIAGASKDSLLGRLRSRTTSQSDQTGRPLPSSRLIPPDP